MMVIIVVIVAMDMDDVPRFELAKDNMPVFKVAQAGPLSKGILRQVCALLLRIKNLAGTGCRPSHRLRQNPRFRKGSRENYCSVQGKRVAGVRFRWIDINPIESCQRRGIEPVSIRQQDVVSQMRDSRL